MNPLIPANAQADAQDRADRRHEAIVRELAEVLRATDMHDAMIEAFRESEVIPGLLFTRHAPEQNAQTLSVLRIAAVRARAGSLARAVTRRNERLHCTAEDIDDEVAGDAIYFMNNGRMP